MWWWWPSFNERRRDQLFRLVSHRNSSQKRMMMMVVVVALMLLSRDAIGSRVENFMCDVFDADSVAIVYDPFGILAGRRLIR